MKFPSISWQEQVTVWWDSEDVCLVLDQVAECYIDLLTHSKRPSIVITPDCCVLSEKIVNTNFTDSG